MRKFRNFEKMFYRNYNRRTNHQTHFKFETRSGRVARVVSDILTRAEGEWLYI